MQTIKITSAHRGQTVATNRTLTRLTFTKAPTAYGGRIRLMDDALTAAPKALFYEDVSTSWHFLAFLDFCVSPAMPRSRES
jgi:hypothetical protein